MTARSRPLVWSLLGLAFAPIPGLAQTTPATTLALETNRFYSAGGPTLIEGALEIPYALLAFAPDGESLRAHARVEVMIDRQSGEEVYRTEREITPLAVNEAMARSARVTSLETFAIYAPSGEYIARARVTDLTNTRTFEMSMSLTVPDATPMFSDMVLSNHVQKNVRMQEGSYLPYLIGTTMFHPSPRKVFYKDAPLAYFYYEINPEAVAIETDALELDLVVTDPDGNVIKSFGPRMITITEDRTFDIGAFSVAGLPAGEYRLVARCADCDGEPEVSSTFAVQSARQELVFFDPEADKRPAAPALKYYANFSDAQADSVLGVVDLLFTTNQRGLVKTLNRDGKITFLNRFWDSLDPDPVTPANEFKQEFERRVAYADQFFSTMQIVGHKTERGEIRVLFGEPTETVDRPFESATLAYVIWTYANEGQTFAFGDFGKNGNYRLIYSTDRRFPGDPQFQNFVDNEQLSAATFIRTGRGYEKVIEDIRFYRTRSAGLQ